MTETNRTRIEASPLALAAYGLIALIWDVRLAVEGLDGPVFSDAGAYLYAGNSLLTGHGLTAPDGELFHPHGPVGPILIAVASNLVGTDPFTGPKLAFAIFFLASLLGAVRVAQLLGGDRAALCTSAALAAVPFVWSGFLEVLIDQPQLGMIVATILLLMTPTPARVVGAGVVFGLCILTKETVALAALMPLAWLGTLPVREIRRILMQFIGAIFVTAFWWWVLVWVDSAVVFPFDQIGRVASRSTERFGIGVEEVLSFAVLAAAWVWFVMREKGRAQSRLVMLAGLGMVPPAIIAVSNQLDFRQLLVISALTCIAGGVALAGWLRENSSSKRMIGPYRSFRVVTGTIIVLAVALVARAQIVTQPGEPLNLGTIVWWLNESTVPEEQIAITYAYRREILSRVDHPLRIGTVIDLRSGVEQTNESRDTPLRLAGCGYCLKGETARDRGEKATDSGWVDLISVRRALVDPGNELIVIARAPSLAKVLIEHFPAIRFRYHDAQGINVFVLSVDHEKIPDAPTVDRILRRHADELLLELETPSREEANSPDGQAAPGSS
ncbi:MAG: ArnT family glycosyltransferase [Solirubrobacterales bacterium]